MITKEVLEYRDWKFKSEFNNIIKFEKGDVWKDDGMGAFLSLDIKNQNIIITTTDKGFNQDGPNYSVKFNGTCSDMETFELICGLIKLKL